MRDMNADDRGLHRRDLLLSAAAATGTAFTWGLVGARPALAQKGAPTADAFPVLSGPQFFTNAGLNYSALNAFGVVGQTAEFGEVATVVAKVQARGQTYRAYAEEFIAMADLVGGRADAARKAGQTETARACSLRAACYLGQALFYALAFPGDREPELYRRMDRYFTQAMHLTPNTERVRIPYGRSFLPGWLLRPAGKKRRRPTIVFTNGSDGQNIDLIAFGADAAVKRGYNALIYEGPGQGSMLFLRNIPFRPDWNAVITPIMDFLLARDDVDRKRVAQWGWSFAGELLLQACAHEHRSAALVVDPAALTYAASWPAAVIATAYDGDKAQVDASWANFLANSPEELVVALRKRLEIFRIPSWYDVVREMAKYDVTGLLGRITTPTLITAAELEQFWPGESQTVYDQLKAPKTLHHFTSADGSQWHCEPMAPQHRNEVILDWLAADSRLG
jgi:dienelactone hydrolase